MNNLILPSIAAGALLYKGYKAFKVPEDLKHIPRIPISSSLASVIQGEGFDQRYECLIKPTLEEHGCGLIWIQGQWELMVIDPKQAREILSSPDKFLKRSEETKKHDKRLISALLGKSNILFNDGEEWRKHRKVANPAFKQSWDTQIFGDIMADVVAKIENMEPDPHVDVVALFKHLTLDALGKGLFSYDFEAVKNSENDINIVLYHEIMRELTKPLYFMFPFLEGIVPSRIKSYKSSQRFRKFLQGIISERRQEIETGVAREDLLTRMILASKEDNSPSLSDEEVINDLVVFFLAGHDTTASTLTTIFYYLSKHPEIQDKARIEVMKVLGNPSTLTIPTTEQTKEMVYITCVIKEAMRIITTVSQLRRISDSPVTLSDGFHIPANTPINIQNWGIHHDEEVYPNSYTFNPDRFLTPHNSENTQWMAFGSGSRMCIGMNFSILEQRVVLAMLLQQFTFHSDPKISEQPLKLSSTGLIRANEVCIQFRSRDSNV